MKKLIVIGIIILLVGMSIPSTGINVEKSTASYVGNTLYVGGSGPGNYTKIQDAIDNASEGDTVFVFNGTYNESLNVGKSIELKGEDKETTAINSYISFQGAEWVILNGFTTSNIFIGEITDLIISNNNIIGNGEDIEGILIYMGYGDFIISDNNISNWGDEGIYYHEYSNHPNFKIINNTFLNNSGGIFLDGKDHVINGNILINNNIALSLSSSKCEIFKNTFQNNKLGLTVYGDSNNINHNNFIDNKRSAFFVMSFNNTWNENYWNRARYNPKPIYGNMGISPIIVIAIGSFLNCVIGRIIPLPLVFFDILLLSSFFFCSYFPTWINFDWHPAREPYDI